MQNQITAFGARFAWPLATVALAVAAGGLLVRMIHSGPWIDEFFTLYATDPGRSYAQLWAVLRHDNHPPLYNVLIWMLRRLTDLSIEEGRALNAVPLTACLAYWLWCFRAERDRPVLAVFLLLFLSAHQLQSQIADFRSYLWLIVTVSSLSLAAWRLLDPPQGRIGKADSAAFAISLFVTANLHYVGTLYAACLTAALLAALAHQQRFSLAGGVAAGALALASPAAIFALQQTGVLASRTGGVFWLKHDLLGGLLTIAKSVVLNVGANVAALAAAGLAAWGLSRQGLRRAAASLRPVELVLAASLTAFLAALLIVSLHTPVISARYLGLIAGPVSLLVALLACRLPRRRVVIAAVGQASSACLTASPLDSQPDILPQPWAMAKTTKATAFIATAEITTRRRRSRHASSATSSETGPAIRPR